MCALRPTDPQTHNLVNLMSQTFLRSVSCWRVSLLGSLGSCRWACVGVTGAAWFEAGRGVCV